MNSTIIQSESNRVNARTLVVRNPYDDSVVGEVEVNTAAEAKQSIERASALFADRSNWLDTSQRLDILAQTKELLHQRREQFAMLATREGGKPIADSLIEVDRAIIGLRVCCDVMRTQTGQMIPMGLNAASRNRIAYTCPEPIGPVLAYSAFNHPLNLIVHQVAPAVAVGCPVIVKPAEATPLSCEKFVNLMHQAGLPKEWCQVTHVDSIPVASQMVGDQRLSFFTFVGSAKVGWQLRSKLAAGVRCTLEHGGTAPVIVDAQTSRMPEVIKAVGKGGFYHSGQVCVSVQKVFVQQEQARNFAHHLADYANQLKVGDPADQATEAGPLIRRTEVDRIHEWVLEGIASGGELCCGGEELPNNCYQPTVLFDPAQDARISQLEIFGPVVCVYPFRHVDEAIRIANSSPFSFQAAVFSNSNDFVNHVVRNIDAATVMVNDHTAFRVDWMPFAGHKLSGLGTGGIAYTMREMQKDKLIVASSHFVG